MLVAVYITTVDNKLLLQYLPTVDAPNFKTLWPRMVATMPELANLHSDSVSSAHLSNNLVINKYYSKVNNIIYWCLSNKSDPKLLLQSGLKWSIWLEELDLLLLDYFDKDNLSMKKIINNYDQITLIINVCINNGEPMVGSQYMNQIKDLIPMKSDLSKMINSTTNTIQNAVNNSRFHNNNTNNNRNFSFERSHLDSFNNSNMNDNTNIDDNNDIVPWRKIPSITNGNSNTFGLSNKIYKNSSSTFGSNGFKNEYYIDIVETVSLTLMKNKTMHNHNQFKKLEILHGSIIGQVNSRSYLYDTPMIEINFNKGSIPLGLPSLHNCIDLNSFDLFGDNSNTGSDNFKLKFIPPNGKCQLMKYDIVLGNDNSEDRKFFNVDLISCHFANNLGYKNDEFEISLNINGSNKIKKITNLHLKFNFNLTANTRDNENNNLLTDNCDYKIRILRSTTGLFEQQDKDKTGEWIFDKELPTRTIATLRGCIVKTLSNDNISAPSSSSINDFTIDSENSNINNEQAVVNSEPNLSRVIDIYNISLNYQYEGQLFSGIQVKSIDVTNMKGNLNSSNDKLYKGVKYCTKISDIEMRM